MASHARPNLFAFRNYREYLRAFYLYEKQQSEKFSYRVFAARAGFKSPNSLKLVIDGQRNLTLNSIRKIAVACRLSPAEVTFFRNLVMLEQAKTPGEKARAQREMEKSAVFRDMYMLKQAQLEFYQNWYSIPLREMISSPSFQEDPQWIAEKLNHAVDPKKIPHAIENLLTLGLIRRNAHGQLEQCQRNVSTGNDVDPSVVAGFHRRMIGLALDSIDSVKRYRREISSSTILMSVRDYDRLKELIQDFRKTILAEAESTLSDGQAVYQINFQLFPVTDDLQGPGGGLFIEGASCKKTS